MYAFSLFICIFKAVKVKGGKLNKKTFMRQIRGFTTQEKALRLKCFFFVSVSHF